MSERLVVVRLTGAPETEGLWFTLGTGTIKCYERGSDDEIGWVSMVATGNVEWDGDRCAEVYVPSNRLALWRAEHDVD